MTYREPAKPNEKPAAASNDLVHTVVGLLVAHVGSFVALWIFFGVLRWSGANGIGGLLIRTLGTGVIILFAAIGTMFALGNAPSPTTSMIRAFALAAIYLTASIIVARSVTPHAPLIFPRAGVINVQVDFVSLCAAAFVNPGIVMGILFGLAGGAANKKRPFERAMKLLMAAPCEKCGGEMIPRDGLMRCTQCDHESPLPNKEDVDALARTLVPPER